MYIKSIKLIDFQSHKNTKIEFSKNFNCIIGSTDAGKSSIIRALKFVLFGEPWEKSFVNYDSDFCQIEIEFSNNVKIIRKKGENINQYIINDKVYNNFGTNIPSDIKTLVNIDTIKIDDNREINLNFSDQLDSIFLVNESDSVKARILNKLSGLDIIDNILKDLNNDKRDIILERNKLKQDLFNIEEEVKQYDKLEKKKGELDIIKLEIDKLKADIDKLNILSDIQNNIKIWKQKKSEIQKLEKEYEDLEKIDVDIMIKQLDDFKSFNNIYELYNRVINLSKEIDNINKLIEDCIESEKKYIKKYENYLREIKKCPICGSNIDDKTISKCLSEL